MSKFIPIVIIGSLILIFAGIFYSTYTPSTPYSQSEVSGVNIVITPMTVTRFQSLQSEDLVVGTGPAVKAGDVISVHYSGTLVDGQKFDSSYDRGQPFSTQIGVGRVIKGWDEGMVGMQVGGKRKLLIPASMGYGPNGSPPVIPGDSDLIFEVELLEIK